MTDEKDPAIPDVGDGDASSSSEGAEPASGWSGRFLHLILILLIGVPVVVWALGIDRDGEETPLNGTGVGEIAPDFTLELFDGATFSMSRHLAEDGRPVVLNFWASWCVPCREEMPAFDAVARRRSDILILGVAVQDTEPAAHAFAEEVGVSYPLGHDADGTILEKYPILGLPATWFITSDGAIAEQWFGQLDETRLEELIEELQSG